MFIPKSDYRTEETQRCILAASITFKVGDIVKLVGSGSSLYYNTLTNASVAGAYYPIGVLVGFSKENGEVIGQGQDPANTPNQLTTTATNLSTEKYYGVFLPITSDMEWEADLNAAVGTTNYSGQYGAYYQLADCRTVDESTAVAGNNVAAASQFMLTGVHPTNTRKVFGKLIKSAWTRGYTCPG